MLKIDLLSNRGVFTPPFQEKVPMVSTPSPSRTLTTTSIMTSKYLFAKDIIKPASMQAMIVDNFTENFDISSKQNDQVTIYLKLVMVHTL